MMLDSCPRGFPMPGALPQSPVLCGAHSQSPHCLAILGEQFIHMHGINYEDGIGYCALCGADNTGICE